MTEKKKINVCTKTKVIVKIIVPLKKVWGKIKSNLNTNETNMFGFLKSFIFCKIVYRVFVWKIFLKKKKKC